MDFLMFPLATTTFPPGPDCGCTGGLGRVWEAPGMTSSPCTPLGPTLPSVLLGEKDGARSQEGPEAPGLEDVQET